MSGLGEKLFVRFLQIVYTLIVATVMIFLRLKHGPKLLETKKRTTPPKCLEGWNSRYLKLKNVRLHYVQTGEDSKPLMLMIHGFPEFWYSWRFQLREFQDDYRCVAIDQRGYNLSDKPMGVEFYTAELLVNDVKEVIEALGYEKAVVVGHDWGALVAWKLAISYPELVDRLVILNAPHPTAFMKVISTNFKQFRNSWYLFFFQTRILPEMCCTTFDYKKLMLSLFLCTTTGTFSTANLQRLPPVKPRTLIIWGTGDTALVPECAKNSLKYCEDGEVKYVEGASHWVQQDEPKIVNRHIREFLEQRG
ncbi:unnamed protein product [Caenorhabditis auriculariae]|uniref:AB hydrolase-1 domain-containing protein n=1 Tax=Caenorhabditis auriculariae TaxID=2777116 RepID=A0A8S1H5E8_9PELO|nr:unnamed protein product [Caenorhabditis auriculariae]